MSTRHIDWHVEVSDDAETEFGFVADVLDHFAQLMAFDPYVHGFLITRAEEARKIEIVMRKEKKRGS